MPVGESSTLGVDLAADDGYVRARRDRARMIARRNRPDTGGARPPQSRATDTGSVQMPLAFRKPPEPWVRRYACLSQVGPCLQGSIVPAVGGRDPSLLCLVRRSTRALCLGVKPAMPNTCTNCGDPTTNPVSRHSGSAVCDDCDSSIFVGPTPLNSTPLCVKGGGGPLTLQEAVLLPGSHCHRRHSRSQNCWCRRRRRSDDRLESPPARSRSLSDISAQTYSLRRRGGRNQRFRLLRQET